MENKECDWAVITDQYGDIESCTSPSLSLSLCSSVASSSIGWGQLLPYSSDSSLLSLTSSHHTIPSDDDDDDDEVSVVDLLPPLAGRLHYCIAFAASWNVLLYSPTAF